MARSLLIVRNVSKDFWVEAIACSIYILNISPTSSVQGKLLEEAQSVKEVIVSHLCFFGCIAFAHVQEELRRSLMIGLKEHFYRI